MTDHYTSGKNTWALLSISSVSKYKTFKMVNKDKWDDNYSGKCKLTIENQNQKKVLWNSIFDL